MTEYSYEKLNEILRLHRMWVNEDTEGKRADLSGADLSGADLSGADLRDADLSGADLRDADLRDADLSGADLRDADLSGADLRRAYLRGADLRGADLSGAYLSGAYLRGADLRGADLEPIKKDFFEVLSQAVNEISYLEKAIIEGRINGSTYEGECACLCGTIENAGNKEIARDASRPIEIFFLSIKKGDTPENNQFSKIVLEWLQEFKMSLGEKV
jgi:hypothetical protein